MKFVTLFLVLFQKFPGTSDPESDLEFGLGSDFEEGCLIDGPDSDGDTYESDGHYYRRCKVEMDFSLEFCDITRFKRIKYHFVPYTLFIS